MDLEQKYAQLIVKKGANLQRGEEVFIVSSVETFDFARTVTQAAYEAGAKKVTVLYTDDVITKTRLAYEPTEVVESVEPWEIAQRDMIADKPCAYISILSEDPDAYADSDGKKLAALSRARHKAFKKFYDMSRGNVFKWCLAGYPSERWARKVFPDCDNAVDKLKSHIFHTMRVDTPDPMAAWDLHCKRLEQNCKYLNEMQFDAFEYSNSLGTRLTVGMPKNYRFMGGGEDTVDGKFFIANMPTEEVFSAPDRTKVNGTVYASMPLVHNGKIVRDFYLTLKDGRIVDFDAKEGREVLEEIIVTDEGSHYLGEIALVGYDTPIRSLDTLFYNTLFDENASCHFAIGSAYTSSVEGGEQMSKEEQLAVGLNDSLEHVDFMVGTKDLSIVGIKDGKRYPVFTDGVFSVKNS